MAATAASTSPVIVSRTGFPEAALASLEAALADSPRSNLPPACAEDWEPALALSEGTLRHIVHFGAIPSTQTLAEALVGREGASTLDGTAFVVDTQLAGRGRGGNTWDSPPPGSGLMVTLVRSVPKSVAGATLPLAQHVASLAALRSTREVFPDGESKLRIKWPNDLHVVRGSEPSRKAGGILCTVTQSLRDADSLALLIGMGINVKEEVPTRGFLLELCSEAERKEWVATDSLRSRLLGAWSREFSRLWEATVKGRGPSGWRDEYTSNWLHNDQSLTLADGSTAVVTGLSDAGCIVAQLDDSDECVELGPGEHSVDLMSGMVRLRNV
jgi:biotin-(acetyl-CoA carboxylase) ligase